jgi:hypothetical protein
MLPSHVNREMASSSFISVSSVHAEDRDERRRSTHHVLREPSNHAPQPQRLDHRMHALRGTTMALDLQPARIQRSKHATRPPPEVRLIELLRLNAAYRREIQFFRTAYYSAEAFLERVWDVCQQMILQYYLHPTVAGERDDAWLAFATKMEDAVRQHQSVLVDVEEKWAKFWTEDVESGGQV